jgi:hypothetical protein
MFTVRFNVTQGTRNLEGLTAKAPQAIARALNRSIDSAKTVMVREVSQDLKLKSGDVRNRILVNDATATHHVAQLRASARRIPLIDFGARQTQRGVTAKLSGGRTRYPHAFIATVGSGRHTGVFQRKGNPRLPIRELFGPSIARVFLKHVDVGLARGQEQLVKNLQSEIRFALRRTA